MIHSQINILKDNSYRFNYHVAYVDDIFYTQRQVTYGINTNGDVLFYHTEQHNITRDVNYWVDVDPSQGYTDYLADDINMSSLDIYFPQFSVETYDPITWYNIAISTFINGVRVVLGSYLICRKNALAMNRNLKFKNINYQEYINVPFVDPWYLCYDDYWKDFRRELCRVTDEQENRDDVNNEGATLYIELTPLENGGDCWISKSGYSGGACNMLLGSDREDRLYTTTRIQLLDHTTPHIVSETLFNSVYEQDLATYMYETYGLDITGCHVHIELVFKDLDNVYKYIEYNTDPESENPFETTHIFTKTDIAFNDWSEYVDGMFAVSSLSIRDRHDNDLFVTMSQEQPFTHEIFKFFIKTDIDNLGGYLNLDYIHMQSYQVDVVNKIEKKVINVNKPDDYKSNILKPVFIQVSALGNTIFHPQVNESVCINLNAFKSKVDLFYLKLEGVEFVETGRTSNGVIFKVTGAKLPNEKSTGVYYILNQDKDLVVTGNYTYIQ